MTQRLFSALLLFCALLLAATPARADKDAVQFGSNIVVPEGHSVHDAVCFFCSVNATGDIDHDVVVFFGNVHIAKQSKHDVVVFFGTLRADDNAAIGHDVVNFFGSVHLGENVTVGNDVVVMFGGAACCRFREHLGQPRGAAAMDFLDATAGHLPGHHHRRARDSE